MTEDVARGRPSREDGGAPARLLTVADVRAAIGRVASGDFAMAEPLSWSFGSRAATARPAAEVPQAAEHALASPGLLGDWSRTADAVGRMRAVESAQLAAFLLHRVLKREGGAEELEAFLTAPDPVSSDSGTRTDISFAAGQSDDPRLSARARRLLASDDMIVVAATLRTRLETARRAAARAIVSFVGLHNLLSSAVAGRLPAERVERLHFRIDDAALPLSQVQSLDVFLDGLDAGLSMDQFEKQARMRIRILDPLPRDPDAARKNRCVRIERRDDDTAVLEMVGPIGVIEAMFQRTRATARAIRRQELGALGLARDGRDLDPTTVAGRLSDDRRIAELMFDLLAGARPQTQLRVGPSASHETTAGEDVPEGTVVDVLCPTDGDWLRKQAQVTITVPASTVLSLDDRPGRLNGDVPVSAEFCRDAASHATSWYRVLTDPATSIVTDHIAQTYEPTAAMRRTVRAKWRTCTVPGCSQPAGWCEIEHCCRFSKREPRSGGLTVMENLHAMCKHHHQLKTMGAIGLKRLGPNSVAWVLPMGVTATTSPPPLAAGADPPDPGELVARAVRADRAPVGRESEGPDLFTSIEDPDPPGDGPPGDDPTGDDRPPF